MIQKLSGFLAAMIGARDPDLADHHVRLAETATRFAGRLGCAQSDIEMLSFGARIHDLGKLGISDFILNKPGRLTPAEFAMVRQHTTLGAGFLAPLELDRRLIEIVELHHENFDGSGYPYGLGGREIPFAARVVRILDAYDALTSDRPYHRGVPGGKALAIMGRETGRFDPELFDEFGRMLAANDGRPR